MLAVAYRCGKLTRGASGRGHDKRKGLLQLTLSGGVVFGLVSDGVLLKVLREAQALPLKSVPLVVCLLDVSEAGARAALRLQGMEGMVAPAKKLTGMTASLLDKVRGLEGLAAGKGWALEVCEISWSHDDGVDLDLLLAPRAPDSIACVRGGAAVDACERMETAMSEARARLVHVDLAAPSAAAVAEVAAAAPILHVVMFVTMVGWGKNALCEALRLQDPSLEEQLGLDAGGRAVILEGDALGHSFWDMAARQARQPDVRLLILNRNFPPNSWEPSRRKMLEAVKGARHVHLIALVPAPPHDVGPDTDADDDHDNRHPFMSVELAVCMDGVLRRKLHASKLDSEQSQETSKVASQFYGFYSGIQGGRAGLLRQVGALLANTIVQLDWLHPSAARRLASEPQLADLRHTVSKLERREYATTFSGADEDTLRVCYSTHAAQAFFSHIRLDISSMARSLIARLRNAIGEGAAGGVGGAGEASAASPAPGMLAVKTPSYVGVEIHEDDMHALILQLAKHLMADSRLDDQHQGLASGAPAPDPGHPYRLCSFAPSSWP